MNEQARTLIETLALTRLDGEGGYFRRFHTFYSESHQESGSTILYLMTHRDFSRMHRLKSDEVWVFLDGSPMEMLTLDSDGSHALTTLGRASDGRCPIATVKAGQWQASRPIEAEGWSLCAATMVPAWDEATFTLAAEEDLAPYVTCPHLSRFIGGGR
ncbi:MAG TPA: cupin domain-containing protein [Sphaerochaeta sp.]|jgi:predicted cupin superfamily sugar epimerase|nr:cupin domain-containing protein [Spirochaetales bacterium]HOE85061.1 cupin domain-containing protein [Sphaerochaeta sp.]HOQ94651.1 cupin domain-containing protein [Sphaerochaeta sp.]HPK47702.1 cupin domain-containing protein [Sphaerochaeta sp.]